MDKREARDAALMKGAAEVGRGVVLNECLKLKRFHNVPNYNGK